MFLFFVFLIFLCVYIVVTAMHLDIARGQNICKAKHLSCALQMFCPVRTDLGNLFALGSARAAIHLDIAQQVFLANARVHVYKCIHT